MLTGSSNKSPVSSSRSATWYKCKGTVLVLLPLHSIRALASLLLSTSNNVDQLKARLQFGYDAADEARGLVAEERYQEAKRAFADALNMGRRPAIALQELL